jgi:hypothetical protein
VIGLTPDTRATSSSVTRLEERERGRSEVSAIFIGVNTSI